MIQLHHDYLLFQTSSGEAIPCSVEVVATELVGGSTDSVDPELVRQAAAAVLHYFKHDLGRNSVSVAEFSAAFERVLQGFGLEVCSGEPDKQERVAVYDLRKLASDSGEGFELAFFPHLREELRLKLTNRPHVLEFQGLRGCVKQLLGAKRWSHRCQELNDQIVEYLRQCLTTECKSASRCGLVVR